MFITVYFAGVLVICVGLGGFEDFVVYCGLLFSDCRVLFERVV